MAERLSNLGYLGLIKEVTKGTPLTPTDYVPVYDETLATDPSIQDLDPIYGNKFKTFMSIPGQRKHKGDITVMAEPNTAARFADMLLTKGSTTGANPYTHPYTLSNTADPKSYTVDISTGNVVKRFWGVEASTMAPDWNDNEMRLKLSVSALGSFQGREVLSVSTNTITFATNYSSNPTKGLIANDLIRFFLANGTTVDTTVTSVTNATTVVVGAATGVAAGDMLELRPATVSLNTLQPFQWAKTEFRFGTTASAALSATQTRLEPSSTFQVMHNFESDDGANRSGDYDPAALVRTQGDVSFNLKKFFDTPEDIKLMNSLGATAVVIRCFSGSTNQYEFRLTINQIITDNPLPQLKNGDINYEQLAYHTNYSQPDGQGYDIKIINGIPTI